MVFRRRSPLGKRAPRRKYARKPKRAVGARKSMVSLIKSVIHKQAENKVKQFTSSSALSNWQGANFGINNIVPLSPYPSFVDIPQGITQSTRVGNKLTVRKAWIKFVVYPRAYDAVGNPIPQPTDLRMMIVKPRDTVNSLLGVSSLGNFFQNGSTASAPSGLLTDIVRDINLDMFKVYYDKTFKLGIASNTGTGASAGSSYYANNDYKLNLVKKIDFTKYCTKTVIFNDNTTIAETPLVQLLCLPVGADGQYFNANPLYWTYNIHFEYEDM